MNYIYSGNVRFEISYLKVTFSLTGIVYRTHETLFRCEMILSCAHAAQAPTSTNSSRSRQECRQPFPLDTLLFYCSRITQINPVAAIKPSRNRGNRTASGKPTLSIMNPRLVWGRPLETIVQQHRTNSLRCFIFFAACRTAGFISRVFMY